MVGMEAELVWLRVSDHPTSQSDSLKALQNGRNMSSWLCWKHAHHEDLVALLWAFLLVPLPGNFVKHLLHKGGRPEFQYACDCWCWVRWPEWNRKEWKTTQAARPFCLRHCNGATIKLWPSWPNAISCQISAIR